MRGWRVRARRLSNSELGKKEVRGGVARLRFMSPVDEEEKDDDGRSEEGWK